MKLGAEPKKVAALGGLVVVAVVVFWINSSSSSAPPSGAAKPPVETARPESPVFGGPPRPAASAAIERARRQRRGGGLRTLQEFKPSLKSNPDEPLDPMSVDPTLRTDLLAKLQAINVEGRHRSLFEFGEAPPPEGTKPATTPVPSPVVAPQPVSTEPPAAPPPPPIPLKFYGYVNPASQADKRAFFIEGEDIHVASEGETLKRRYVIKRIGMSSAVVEDTENKNEQTLPLVQEAVG